MGCDEHAFENGKRGRVTEFPIASEPPTVPRYRSTVLRKLQARSLTFNCAALEVDTSRSNSTTLT